MRNEDMTMGNDATWDREMGMPVVLANAERRGRKDYKEGVVVGDNPYDEHDARFWHWMRGWAGAGLETMDEETRARI
ncbi:MAG: hypothetical protein DRQ14_08080 [Candidatus Latescibacterota bacterium]|nr:MAG: hypothetical protein DRQ14_08080 [Candidatus Latescibacterota bacterium]